MKFFTILCIHLYYYYYYLYIKLFTVLEMIHSAIRAFSRRCLYAFTELFTVVYQNISLELRIFLWHPDIFGICSIHVISVIGYPSKFCKNVPYEILCQIVYSVYRDITDLEIFDLKKRTWRF